MKMFFCFYGSIFNLVTKVVQTPPKSNQFLFNMHTGQIHPYIGIFIWTFLQADHPQLQAYLTSQWWSPGLQEGRLSICAFHAEQDEGPPAQHSGSTMVTASSCYQRVL